MKQESRQLCLLQIPLKTIRSTSLFLLSGKRWKFEMGSLFENTSEVVHNTCQFTSKSRTGRFPILLKEAMVCAEERAEDDV